MRKSSATLQDSFIQEKVKEKTRLMKLHQLTERTETDHQKEVKGKNGPINISMHLTNLNLICLAQG